ncbi:MAG TPA: carboxypeptidase regulatory-like domain-containing protein [Bacteroidales bacterium]|nr:carboxypeptidase regulatory-like domain-containing protein [Bacteroidales bacterium]
MKRYVITCWLTLSSFVFCFGQPVIRGLVRYQDGSPLPGVSITETDKRGRSTTTRGTVTDFDGKFTFPLLQNEIYLKFRFIGLKDTIVFVDTLATKLLEIQLEVDSAMLKFEEEWNPIFRFCAYCRPPDFISIAPFFSTNNTLGLSAKQHNIIHIFRNDFISIRRFYIHFSYYRESNEKKYLHIQFSPVEFFPFSNFSGNLTFNFSRYWTSIRDYQNFAVAYELFPNFYYPFSGYVGFGLSKDNSNSRPMTIFGVGFNRSIYRGDFSVLADFLIVNDRLHSSYQVWWSPFRRRLFIGALYNNFFNFQILGLGLRLNAFYYLF